MKVLRRVPFLREIALLARRFANAVLDEDATFDGSTSSPKPSPRVSPDTPFATKGPPAHWLADVAARAPHLLNHGEIVANGFTSFDLRNDATTDQGAPPSKPRVAPAKPTQHVEAAFPAPTASEAEAKDPYVARNAATPEQTETWPPIGVPTANRQTKPVEVVPETLHKAVVSPDKPFAQVQNHVAQRDNPILAVPKAITRDTFVRGPSSATITAQRAETSVPEQKIDGSTSTPLVQRKTTAPVAAAPQPQTTPRRPEPTESTVWPDRPPPSPTPTKWPPLAPAAPETTNEPWVTPSQPRPDVPKDPTVWQPNLQTPHRAEASPRQTTSVLSRPKSPLVEVPSETHESASWPEITTNLDASQEVSHSVSLEQTKFYEKNDPWPVLDPPDDAPKAEPNILTLELLATRSARLDKEQRGSW